MSSVLNPAGTVSAFTDMLKTVPASAGKARALTPTEAREAARIEGFDQGYQDGFAQAQREVESHSEMLMSSLADHIAAVQGLLHRLDDDHQAAMDRWSQAMALPVSELALAIATRLVGGHLREHPDTAIEMAQQALSEVTHAVDARIKVNPADADTLRQAMPELFQASPTLRHIDVISDPTISAGCRIETDGGIVDATLETMLEQARRAIRQEDEA